MYDRLFEILEEINQNTAKTADNTKQIADNTDQLVANTDNLKKEISDNPRKELAMRGVPWTTESYIEQLRMGDLENIELFYAGKFSPELIYLAAYREKYAISIRYFLIEFPNRHAAFKLAVEYGLDLNKKYHFSHYGQVSFAYGYFKDFISVNMYDGIPRVDFADISRIKKDIPFLLSLGLDKKELVTQTELIISELKSDGKEWNESNLERVAFTQTFRNIDPITHFKAVNRHSEIKEFYLRAIEFFEEILEFINNGEVTK